ncbi:MULTISPECIES: signal peptidase I [unclassified Nesterenkonia]|uniref:signal peptidase I n=1 Tax=unclassified Nesterenkonia TaxID=2629769 RepID=UPI0009F29699|nr:MULTISPECIES: signal peptidase I [unclassified Nesterenkonia]MDS2172418.1 signal peptidase I [Nesterenkonia sp. CL21]OSM44529.1 signal peptidase I [Nesterenkonia sp. PF2B19]
MSSEDEPRGVSEEPASGEGTGGPDRPGADGPQERRRLRDRSPAAAFLVEIATIVVLALIISFVVKTFLMRAFYIPSESMESTLEVDDRIVVNLLAPEVMDVERGDVVVFEDTRGWWGAAEAADTTALQDTLIFLGLMPDTSAHYVVKRVIGMDGDEVECCDDSGRISVNGEPIHEPYLFPGDAPSQTEFSVTVPEGHVWLLGDHRSASADSRAHVQDGDMGAVPLDDVIGRSTAIIWPWDRWAGGGSDRDPFIEVPEAP